MPTAAQYGMALPADADMIRNGASAIRQNATATATALTDATYLKGNWPYSDANQATVEGRWNVPPATANAQPNFPPGPLSSGIFSARRFGSTAIIQEYQEATGHMRVFVRTLHPGNNSAYPPGWRMARPDAAVSNAVGRVVTVWDAVNNREQMIYGDTGVRNISSLLAERIGGAVWLTRFGNTVSVVLTDVLIQTEGTRENPLEAQEMALLPSGFRPRTWSHFSTSPHVANEPRGVLFKADGILRVYNPRPDVQLQGTFSFYTHEPWPTSLPGIPA